MQILSPYDLKLTVKDGLRIVQSLLLGCSPESVHRNRSALETSNSSSTRSSSSGSTSSNSSGSTGSNSSGSTGSKLPLLHW